MIVLLPACDELARNFGSVRRGGTAIAEKDWDKTVGAADDVRRIFENVPAMLVGLEGPDHRFVAVNAAYRAFNPTGHPVGKACAEGLPRARRASRSTRCSTGCIKQVNHNPGQSGGYRPTTTVRESRSGSSTLSSYPAAARTGSIEGVQLVFDDVTSRVQARLAAEARMEELSERYRNVRDSATVMQQALLAPSVPVVPGADITAQYLVAAEDTAAGGDWFDAIALGDRLVLIVGDVVGHGVEAAAAMSQLPPHFGCRSWRATPSPKRSTAVDAFTSTYPDRIRPPYASGRSSTPPGSFSTAPPGHPPPLLVSADADSRYVEPSGAGPLVQRDRISGAHRDPQRWRLNPAVLRRPD